MGLRCASAGGLRDTAGAGAPAVSPPLVSVGCLLRRRFVTQAASEPDLHIKFSLVVPIMRHTNRTQEQLTEAAEVVRYSGEDAWISHIRGQGGVESTPKTQHTRPTPAVESRHAGIKAVYLDW